MQFWQFKVDMPTNFKNINSILSFQEMKNFNSYQQKKTMVEYKFTNGKVSKYDYKVNFHC